MGPVCLVAREVGAGRFPGVGVGARAQVGLIEVGAFQLGPVEARAAQIGTMEVRVGAVGSFQSRREQVGTAPFRTGIERAEIVVSDREVREYGQLRATRSIWLDNHSTR